MEQFFKDTLELPLQPSFASFCFGSRARARYRFLISDGLVIPPATTVSLHRPVDGHYLRCTISTVDAWWNASCSYLLAFLAHDTFISDGLTWSISPPTAVFYVALLSTRNNWNRGNIRNMGLHRPGNTLLKDNNCRRSCTTQAIEH